MNIKIKSGIRTIELDKKIFYECLEKKRDSQNLINHFIFRLETRLNYDTEQANIDLLQILESKKEIQSYFK